MNCRKLSLPLLVSSSMLLAACGGGEIAPTWETFNTADETGYRYENATALIMDSYGDLVTVGTTTNLNSGAGHEENTFIVKQDLNGNVIWKTEYSVTTGTDEGSRDAVIDNDGNIYTVGHSANDGYLAKFDRFGSFQWSVPLIDDWSLDLDLANNQLYVSGSESKIIDLQGNTQLTIAHTGEERSATITPFANGSMLLAGIEFIEKYDAQGNQLWHLDTPAKYSHINDVVVLDNDTVFITYLYDGYDAGLMKIDADGNVLVQKVVNFTGHTGNNVPSFPVLKKQPNGNLLLVLSDGSRRFLASINPANGNVVWSKTHSNTSSAQGVEIDASGNIYVMGGSVPQKFDATGNLLSTGNIPGPSSDTNGSVVLQGGSMFVATNSQAEGKTTPDAQGSSVKIYTARFDL